MAKNLIPPRANRNGRAFGVIWGAQPWRRMTLTHRLHTRADNPKEFDLLALQVRQARINSGRSQAECVAHSYGITFGYAPADLMAAADRDGPTLPWGG